MAIIFEPMNLAYLSLGSNEGNRILWLETAIKLISEQCGTLVKRSSVYETKAWGIAEQPDFLNMVVSIETSKAPQALLAAILSIEEAMGRHRTVKWGPRIIDIDILLYNEEIVDSPDLVIPHPYMQERRFTLIPLVELAPDYVHPKLHKTIGQLLVECPDALEVHKYASAEK